MSNINYIEDRLVNKNTVSIEDTHRAKATYLKGMEQNYPGVDPRSSLLGMKENEGVYENEGYGNILIPKPSRFRVILSNVFSGTGIATIIIEICHSFHLV